MIVQIPDISYITIGMVLDTWQSIADTDRQAKRHAEDMRKRWNCDSYRHSTRADFPSGK